MTGIARIAGSVQQAARAADKTSDPKLHKVAQDFEAVLVRQLLTAAKITGEGKESGYEGMAVDALAGGITRAGGLGLTKQIEAALGHYASASQAPAAPPAPEPAGGGSAK